MPNEFSNSLRLALLRVHTRALSLWHVGRLLRNVRFLLFELHLSEANALLGVCDMCQGLLSMVGFICGRDQLDTARPKDDGARRTFRVGEENLRAKELLM